MDHGSGKQLRRWCHSCCTTAPSSCSRVAFSRVCPSWWSSGVRTRIFWLTSSLVLAGTSVLERGPWAPPPGMTPTMPPGTWQQQAVNAAGPPGPPTSPSTSSSSSPSSARGGEGDGTNPGDRPRQAEPQGGNDQGAPGGRDHGDGGSPPELGEDLGV